MLSESGCYERIVHVSVLHYYTYISCFFFFFFQAVDRIRSLVRSRGLGDLYKGQPRAPPRRRGPALPAGRPCPERRWRESPPAVIQCLSLIHI